MRTLLAILILFVANVLSGQADLDSLYLKAGKAYEAGKFEQSLEFYDTILQKGFESPDLYYNMGNAAFRSNKLGYSILYYEKALKLDPSFEEAKKNLGYVSVYKEDQLEKVPELFLKTWIQMLFRLFSLSTWSILAIVLFAFMLSGSLIYIFSRRMVWKKIGFFSALATLLLFILSLSATIDLNAEIQNPDTAVIISPSIVVKSSPSMSGTDLFILHEGSIVRFDDAVGEWIEVSISDGRIGWIPGETMAVI